MSERQIYATRTVQNWQRERVDTAQTLSFDELLRVFRLAGCMWDNGEGVAKRPINRTPPNGRGAKPKWSDDALLEKLRALSHRLGHTAGSLEINAEGAPYHVTYCRRFGSMRQAQITAGLEPNERGQHPKALAA